MAEGLVLAGGDLVRVKRFEMDPMTIDEAEFQMRLLGHQRYVFLNTELGNHNVL